MHKDAAVGENASPKRNRKGFNGGSGSAGFPPVWYWRSWRPEEWNRNVPVGHPSTGLKRASNSPRRLFRPARSARWPRRSCWLNLFPANCFGPCRIRQASRRLHSAGKMAVGDTHTTQTAHRPSPRSNSNSQTGEQQRPAQVELARRTRHSGDSEGTASSVNSLHDAPHQSRQCRDEPRIVIQPGHHPIVLDAEPPRLLPVFDLDLVQRLHVVRHKRNRHHQDVL